METTSDSPVRELVQVNVVFLQLNNHVLPFFAATTNYLFAVNAAPVNILALRLVC